ncbi:unnamed protein product [Moneuplotes crassus]|uniref:DAGKc domain-containing protein n=1 Tax=Euplotes crassus TaxID=5936 RepID=A0AAD1UEZ4_EUPCR|nr:unnamed protein product [Moneuplotes crassus]
MGSNHSVKISSAVLRKSYLGSVKSDNEEVELYYKSKDCIFTLPKGYKIDETKGEYEVKVKDKFKYDSFLTLDHHSDLENNSLSFKYLGKKNNSIENQTFQFTTQEEYQQAFSILNAINTTQREGKPRHLGIIINPISGHKKSMGYFENVLKPMLDCSGIRYDVYKTTGPTYVQQMMSELDLEKTPYTDFVVIGGDGTLFQLINSCEDHPQKQLIWKKPFGLFPGGSANTVSCNLGCTNEYLSTSRVLKGDTIQADMIEVTLDNDKKIYGVCGFMYGHIETSVQDSGREEYGRYRYFVKGLKDLFSSFSTPTYPISLSYKIHKDAEKNEENKDDGWITHPKNEIFSMIAMQHEGRCTQISSPVLPFIRYNEEKMILFIFDPTNKFRCLEFLFKWILGYGKQLYIPGLILKPVDQIKLQFETPSKIALDGEKYVTKSCDLKLHQQKINLMGKTYPYTDQDEKLKFDLGI